MFVPGHGEVAISMQQKEFSADNVVVGDAPTLADIRS